MVGSNFIPGNAISETGGADVLEATGHTARYLLSLYCSKSLGPR